MHTYRYIIWPAPRPWFSRSVYYILAGVRTHFCDRYRSDTTFLPPRSFCIFRNQTLLWRLGICCLLIATCHIAFGTGVLFLKRSAFDGIETYQQSFSCSRSLRHQPGAGEGHTPAVLSVRAGAARPPYCASSQDWSWLTTARSGSMERT